jgi:hypothetical protein
MRATVWRTRDRYEYCADVTLVQFYNSIGNWISSAVRNEKVGVKI